MSTARPHEVFPKLAMFCRETVKRGACLCHLRLDRCAWDDRQCAGDIRAAVEDVYSENGPRGNEQA